MSASLSWLNSLGGGFVLFTIRMLIQSSVLILILLLLDLVLRRRVRAVVRYWIWLLILVKLVLPPSLSSPTSLVSWIGGRLPETVIVSFVPDLPTAVHEAVPPATPTPMEATPSPADPRHYSPLSAPEQIPAPPVPLAAPVQPVVLPTWQALVLLAWVAAVILMVVLLIQRVFFVRALLVQSQEAPDALSLLLEQCRRQMGVHRVAGVRLTGLSASPSVCGLLRPMILMPEPMARQLDTPQLRSVLFHELAHIQRGDLWINLLQTLLQIVYLYHPLLWLANARIRAIREQAVDEAVLAALGEEAEEYPRTLLSISKLAFGTPSLSLRLLGVVESKRALTARIRHMVSRPFPKSARLGLLGLAAIAVTAAVLLPMARGTQTRTQGPSPGGVVADEQGRPLSGARVPLTAAGSPATLATLSSTAASAGGVIAGVVVDFRGTPIAGASVTVENKDLLLLPQPEKIGSQIRRVIRADSTQTDSEGRFRFTDLTPGKTPITIAAAGYRTEFALSTATGTEDLRVVLGEPRPYRHSGVVADISCRPVAGVEVTFIEETLSGPGKGKDEPPVTVRTDERGQYGFDRLLPPVDRQLVRRFLYARKPGYGVWGCEPDTTGGQATGIIRLMAEEKVSGVVQDEAGAPIAGATVWLSAGWGYFGSVRFASTWQHLAPQTTTRADGSFTLGQLPTDSDLSLQARAEGFASDGVWPIRTGKFGGYAIRRGDTTTIIGGGGEPDSPLTITLQRTVAAPGARATQASPLPPGATAGTKTEWPISAGGNGHFYQGVRMPKPLPWNEADRLAKLLGGHLVTITSAAENDFVFHLIDDDTYWYHSYNWRGPWIGAVQPPGSVEPADGWTWVTGEPFAYTRWDAGQPNNFNGSPENRIHFGNQRSRIPTWNDVRENFEEVVSFVVEWEPAQQRAGIEWPVSQGGNGHFYQVVCVTRGLTWDEANAAAQAQGGYLATITSAQENAFVFALIQDPACWNGPRGPWIGGYQTPGRPVREDWHWVTGEPFEYNHWSPGQPNDGGGADETRLEYGWGATTIADTWNDQPDWFQGVYSYVVEREPGGPMQAAAKLNAWVSLQVLEERVVVLDTLKPFSDYWPKKRHQVVGALSEKETLDYLRRRLQDKESLPIRIHVYFAPETRSAAEDLRQQIFTLAREANAERDTDVRLEPSAYVGSGESPFYLREGKITTFYPHIMPRPDGGPKPITSGLVEPDDLEQHILWRLTMPKNLPLTFRIEYDEASSALAKQVADTAKAVAKRAGLTELVSVAGTLVEPVPESAFLGKWQTLANGVIQSLDIQSAGVCQVTMGEGSEAIKPGTTVKGTWAWTVKEVLLDINDHIRGSPTMPSYVYRATVNGEGNLVIQRGEIWPQGSFMQPRPPEMVLTKVQ